MDLSNKLCLVTGGAGFIGSHLVDLLITNGCRVRVLDNLINGKLINVQHHLGKKNFEFVLGSITDPCDVARAMIDVQIGFHLACLGVRHSIRHPFENHRVNSEGTLLVLDTAYRTGVERFVYCSSSEIYGTAKYVPMPEEHPARPCTVYGSSKLAGEAYTRAYYKTYKMDTVIIRPFNTYGPRSHHEGDAGEMIPKSIVRALNGESILVFGDGSQTRDFTFVEDTAQCLFEAAKSDELIGKTFNAGSNLEITMADIAKKIVAHVGKPSVGIKHVENRPGDVLRLYADSSKIQKTLNWRPKVTLDEGLAKTIAWFSSRPEGARVLLSQEKGKNWE